MSSITSSHPNNVIWVERFDSDDEPLVRVAGLERSDYLSAAEARELADRLLTIAAFGR